MDILDSNTHQNLIPTRSAGADIVLSEADAIRATACRPRIGRLESAHHARNRGLIDIALCSIMWDAMLRRSEAAALTWADVRRAPDGSGRLTVQHSKTDQRGEGKVLWISPASMSALELVASLRPQAPAGPLFNLSPPQITRRLRSRRPRQRVLRTQPARRRCPGPGRRQHLARRHHGARPLAIVADARPLHPPRRRRTVGYGETVRPGKLREDKCRSKGFPLPLKMSRIHRTRRKEKGAEQQT